MHPEIFWKLLDSTSLTEYAGPKNRLWVRPPWIEVPTEGKLLVVSLQVFCTRRCQARIGAKSRNQIVQRFPRLTVWGSSAFANQFLQTMPQLRSILDMNDFMIRQLRESKSNSCSISLVIILLIFKPCPRSISARSPVRFWRGMIDWNCILAL